MLIDQLNSQIGDAVKNGSEFAERSMKLFGELSTEEIIALTPEQRNEGKRLIEFCLYLKIVTDPGVQTYFAILGSEGRGDLDLPEILAELKSMLSRGVATFQEMHAKQVGAQS